MIEFALLASLLADHNASHWEMSCAEWNNNRIEIRGFGSFFPKTYNSYNGRNPKTGETILVPKKILPIFRPSKDLLTKLNKKKG